MKMKRLSATVLTLAMASLSLAGTASAQTTDPALATDPAPILVTVPVFGTSMVITIQTDAAGQFVTADITPATAPTDPTTAPVFDLTVDRNSHGGFELNFTNSADGVKIEVGVVDSTVTKTEVETSSSADPIAATGAGQWTGDPLGNGDFATVDYSVALGVDGLPVLTVDLVNGQIPQVGDPAADSAPITVGADTFAVVEPQASNSHEGETKVIQKVMFYNVAGDYIELAIEAGMDHGKLEVKTKVVDPNAQKNDDDSKGDDDQGSASSESDDSDQGSASSESDDSDRGSQKSNDDSGRESDDD